jgi:aminopeptidase N
MADANGKDFGQFERWYLQSGTPTVAYSHSYDAAANTFSLTLKQSTPTQPGNLPFHIPVSFGIIDSAGGAELLSTQVLELKEAEATFTFPLAGAPAGTPTPSLLRGFSAPVKLVNEKGEDDAMLAVLAAYDTDGFNRWENGQKVKRATADT